MADAEGELLLLFFLRIALLAGLAFFLGLHAALVVAFLASFLGLVAAAFGIHARGRGENSEGAGDHREQFDALHIGPINLVVLQDSPDFGLTPRATGRRAVQFVPVISANIAAKRGFCKQLSN